ncbi:MAG: wax ester/triacylglycerol synthase family O-acyltransferase [Deltaproteobacteria bacterium]|nr:MAG: wax ester/triacylglycerol synthase family O-acyltransferase [Deltaproteobacteria bacterium]
MARYQRLSALDRFFLDVEGYSTHMHVAATAIFEIGPLRSPDGGIAMNRIRDYVASRLYLIPRYRQRLAYIPIENHPVWVDDERFTIRYHVRHTALPKPGNERQLKRLSARIMSQKLDRSRPLWELWVVEGLEDDRFALISKTHHCMIDGVSGVDLMTVLLDILPETEFPEPVPWNPEPAPTSLELLRDDVVRRVSSPLRALSLARKVVEDPRAACESATEAVTALAQTVGVGFQAASDTPFNRRIGAYRRFDWLRLDLSGVKHVKNQLGGTVNDVVLSIVAGAVGRFFERRGIPYRDQEQMEFRVFCPVSVRDPSQRGRLGNRVSGMLVKLPIAVRDPRRRIEAIIRETKHVKDSKQALGAEVLTAVSEWTVPTLLTLGARLATRARAYNMIVTNVPGPQVPLYLLGAKLLEPFPLVPLFGNQALGIALFSYAGKLCWGFNAAWDIIPDLHDFVRDMEDSFAELLAAAGPRVDAEAAAPAREDAAGTVGANGGSLSPGGPAQAGETP